VIANLSYVGFSSPAAESWRRFGPDVLGLALAPDGPDGAVRLRADEMPWRISVHPGHVDDLAFIGWEVAHHKDLEATIARVESVGLTVTIDRDVAADREVEHLAWFVDANGFRHELSAGRRTGTPFSPGRQMSGFVTGAGGLGHLVLIVPDIEASERFLVQTLGFKLSDTIHSRTTLRFFHCPGHAARHHSIALAAAPGMVGMHHLMLEVASVDDVGSALDLINQQGIPLSSTLGRHTNDLMTSFYVRTPSGFELEYGTGGVLIDDDGWDPTIEFDATSRWGHKPPPTPLERGIIRPFTPANAK
jgi:extradiol dioxygenase